MSIMRKKIIIIIGISLFLGCFLYYFFLTEGRFSYKQEKNDYHLPKVAFLTCGTNAGNGILPAGAVVALQVFNKLGIHTSIVSRDILLDPQMMSTFTIIIASTAIEYYDVDRKYSLTFMSDIE